MSHYTDATFRRRRYGAEITNEADHRADTALATAVIDPADLADLLRRDKLAGAALLANLDAQKLLVQAIACATFFNETYGYDAGEGVSTEMMHTQLQKIAAIYRATRVDEQPVPYRPPVAWERPILLPVGRVVLDRAVLDAAYRLACQPRELWSSRWQNALKRGYEHLCGEIVNGQIIVGIRHDGAYFWTPDDDRGGFYAVMPATCSCEAFQRGDPCKHRGAALILACYGDADAVQHAHRYAA